VRNPAQGEGPQGSLGVELVVGDFDNATARPAAVDVEDDLQVVGPAHAHFEPVTPAGTLDTDVPLIGIGASKRCRGL